MGARSLGDHPTHEPRSYLKCLSCPSRFRWEGNFRCHRCRKDGWAASEISPGTSETCTCVWNVHLGFNFRSKTCQACQACFDRGLTHGVHPSETNRPRTVTERTTVKDEDLEEALALSLSLCDSSSLITSKEEKTHTLQQRAPQNTLKRTLVNNKKKDQRLFLFEETVTVPPLPYRCSCGWLNPRSKRAVKSGWDVCRMWCMAPGCGKERSEGYWVCHNPLCAYENKIKPYDLKYNDYTPDPPQAHKCNDCKEETRKIHLVYKDGLEMDPLTEAYIIAECKAKFELCNQDTASNG